MNKGPWTTEECRLFEEAVGKFNKDWDRITSYIGTRTKQQVQSHAQKYSKHLDDERRRNDLYNYKVQDDENNGLRRHRTRKKVFELTTTYSKSKSRSVKKSVTVVDSQDSVSQETCNDSNNTNDDGLTSSGSQPLQSHNHMYSNTERCISDDDAVTLLLRFKHTVLLKSDPYNSFKSNPLVVYSPVPYSHVPVNVFQSNHLTNCNSNHFQYTPTFSKNAFQLS